MKILFKKSVNDILEVVTVFDAIRMSETDEEFDFWTWIESLREENDNE